MRHHLDPSPWGGPVDEMDVFDGDLFNSSLPEPDPMTNLQLAVIVGVIAVCVLCWIALGAAVASLLGLLK